MKLSNSSLQRLLSVRVTLLLLALALTGALQAQVPIERIGQEADAPSVTTPKLSIGTPAASRVRSLNDIQPLTNEQLKDASQVKQAEAIASKIRKAPRKAAASSADVLGNWIMTSESLFNGWLGCGGELTIKESTAQGVYILDGFWQPGLQVAAQINLETGVITIPCQNFAKLTDGTLLDVTAIVPATGSADRQTNITGQLNADGSISIDTWWGVYDSTKSTIAEGGNYGAYYLTKAVRPNGKMTFVQNAENFSFNIYGKQIADNVFEVTNLINGGQTIEMITNRDLTATIKMQPIYGSSMSYSIVNATIEGESVSFTTPITTDTTTNKKEITWTNWTGYGLTSESKGSWLGMFTDTKLTFDFDVNYPSLTTTALQGEGTAEKPYLITCKDDFVFLADRVNSAKYEDIKDDNYHVCTGEYYKMTNDIDMSGTRFTAIGNSYYIRFNGNFDGGGYTIKGLNIVDTQSLGYAGLFGRTGFQSVIANVNFVDANITSQGYAGCAAAGSNGEIYNVTVKNSKLTAFGGGVGAVCNFVNRIYNCQADSCTITGHAGYVGGIAGEVSSATVNDIVTKGYMRNCFATNMKLVVGSAEKTMYPSGGLVALLNYECEMTDSYFSGTIDATLNYTASVTGGAVGYMYGSKMERCFAVGTVRGYSSDAYTGGLVGHALSAVVNDCYSVGRVDGTARYTGGLFGYMRNGTLNNAVIPGAISNCYSANALTAYTYLYDPTKERREILGFVEDGSVYTFENIYFNNQLVNFGSTEYGVPGSYLTSATAPQGFSTDNWTITEGQYPRLNTTKDTEAALYSASALLIPENNSLSKLSADATFDAMGATDFGFLRKGKIEKEGYYSKFDGNKLVLNDQYKNGQDTLFIVNGSAQYHYFVNVAPVPYDGDGTADSPYLIKTKDDLISLSEITTTNKQTLQGAYFKMTNDIDLEYSENFLGICNSGNSTLKFQGHFDGGGFAVHKMRFNRTSWTLEPTETTMGKVDTKGVGYCGFIGALGEEGSVSNLTIAADCDIELASWSGTVVGYNFGLVENCRNFANVTTYAGTYVGGLVGYNNANVQTIIRNCYNAGTVTGGRYGIGGISGNNYGLIENCVNVGNVTAKVLSQSYAATTNYMVGGISGTMGGCVKNCVNYGTITGNDRVGGISGSIASWSTSTTPYKNDVINTINLGIVYGTDPAKTGAIGGATGSNGEIKNVYWDAQVLPLQANANTGVKGMEGLETSAFISGTAFEGFDATIWDFTKGVYPVIKTYAEEPVVKIARSIIVNVPAGKTVYDLTGISATLTKEDGLTWALEDTTNGFTLTETTVAGPTTTNAVVQNKLYATTSLYVKPILIKALPAVPLKGAGTEGDPYQLTSAADWNALSSYMTDASQTMEGKYLAITNDFAFAANDTFSPLAKGAAETFNGILDGKGYTVSGIKFTTTATFQGAIGVIGSEATVKNLTLSGNITSAQASTGGFAGKIYGTLENCVNAINVTSTKATLGGMAATLYGNARLTNCINRANLSGVSNVGGMAGTFDTTCKAILTGCGNEGQIKGNTTSAYIGGIVGTAMPSEFINCYNSGEITMTTLASQSFAAGIIAYANGYKDAPKYLIKGCRNTGNISGKNGLAGILANVSGTSGYATTDIIDCTNSGTINASATASTSNASNAGIASMVALGSTITNCHNSGTINGGMTINTAGILGLQRIAATAALPIRVTGCSNTGDVTSGYYQVGGIIASVQAYNYVDSCFNTGKIVCNNPSTLNYAVGGIAGAINAPTGEVKNCWNTGDVTGVSRVGGIIGMNNSKALISDCWNAGNISSSSETQGIGNTNAYAIGGVAGQAGAVITRCYNVGTVKGLARTGGVVGAPNKNNTRLIDCYNAGKIDAPLDSCGNLVGVNIVNNGSLWVPAVDGAETGNAIINSYYVTDYGVADKVGDFGTAVTIAQLTKANISEDYEFPADYCLPILKQYGNLDEALFNSAAVVVASGSVCDEVTKDFNVGTPAGIIWSSSVDALTIDGNAAKFVKAYSGDIVLTAKMGDLSREVTIKANVTTSGINEMGVDANAEAEYYNMQGVRVENPEHGQIYIVRRGSNVTKELYRIK